jgi:hypothetical protein
MDTEVSRETEELHPVGMEARVAVMAVQIGHIGETLQRIEFQGRGTVPRPEWEQRNLYVDGRFSDHAIEIAKVRRHCVEELAELKSDISSRRAPWWTIIASIGGLIAMVALAIEYLPRIVN